MKLKENDNPRKVFSQMSSSTSPATGLQTVRVIGSGAFGSVYLVKDTGSNALYAMKVIKCAMMNEQQQQYLMREIQIMRKVVHPTLLKLTGFSLPSDKSPDATILTEYMQNGSLFGMLQNERRGKAPLEWNSTAKTKIIFGVAAGMRYLHSVDIIHRDLKTENVLLDDKLEPKIGDFGLSKMTQGNDPRGNTQRLGTPLYMAPEIFRNAPYDHKVDVYAFAMLTFEVVTGINPFADMSNPMALGMKVVQGVRPEIPSTCPEPYRRLIEICWSQEAAMRPEFSKIVEQLFDDDYLLPGSQEEIVRQYRKRICPDVVESPRKVDLNTNVRHLEEALAQKSRELDELKRIVTEQSAMFTKMIESERNERAQLRAKLEHMELQLEEVKNENKELRDAIGKPSQVETFRSELVTHTKRLNSYAEDIKNAGRHLDSLHQEAESLKRELSGFRMQVNSDVGEIRNFLNMPEPVFQPEVSEKKIRQMSDPRELRDFPRVRTRSKRHSETRRSDGSIMARLNGDLAFQSNPFNGILAHMTKQNAGRNIVLSGILTITGSSPSDVNPEKVSHLVDYESVAAWDATFPNTSWLMFDFGTRQIAVCAYTLKTYDAPPQSLHLKSWVLEGSNDSQTWTDLDAQTDNNRLNESNKRSTFTCRYQNSPPVRYVRLRQTGPNHSGAACGFALANVEFFGYIV